MNAPHPNSKPQPRRSLIPVWAWTAATALLLFAAFTTWQAQRVARDLAGLERQASQQQQRARALDSERQRYQQALQIIAAAATRQIQLKPPASPSAPTPPAVTAYWNPQMGLVLAGSRIPAMPSGRTLQLWIAPRAGASVSAAIFSPDAAGQIFLVMPPSAAMNMAKSLTITDEPAGGSPQPTTAPQWLGPLP